MSLRFKYFVTVIMALLISFSTALMSYVIVSVVDDEVVALSDEYVLLSRALEDLQKDLGAYQGGLSRRGAFSRGQQREIGDLVEGAILSLRGSQRALVSVRQLDEFEERLMGAVTGSSLGGEGLGILKLRVHSMSRSVDASYQRELSYISRRNRLSRIALLVFAVIGTVVLTFASSLFLGDFFRSIRQLVRAGRQIEQGDLDVEIRIGGNDELAELGRSFNVMSRFLEARRRRQNIYNTIVTKLNSTISVDATVAIFLGEVLARTDIELGAVYLRKDERAEGMDLVGSVGLSAENMPQRVGVDDGLSRLVGGGNKAYYLDAIPFKAFALDVGYARLNPTNVLVYPMVHLDRQVGMVVLGSFRSFKSMERDFLEELMFQLTVSVSNGIYYDTALERARVLEQKNSEILHQKSSLERVNVELRQANRLKTEFLANVSHELRTPLNSIIGYVELMLDEELSEEVTSDLRTVQRNAHNLYEMITNLLDLSMLEGESLKLVYSTFDASVLLEEVFETAKTTVRDKDVKLVLDVDGFEGLELTSDRMKCRQVLLNLVSNAIKFTERGSVELMLRADDSHVSFEVKDSGIGISKDKHELIFKKFSQLDGSSTRRYGGAGLGLAIVERLCGVLDGEVLLESDEGEGALFKVMLPRRGEGLGASSSGVWGARATSTTNLHNAVPYIDLLVVNDDPGVLARLRASEGEGGLTVANAFTLEEAEGILKRNVVLDVLVCEGALKCSDGGSRMTQNGLEDLRSAVEGVVVRVGVGDDRGEEPLMFDDVDAAVNFLREQRTNHG